MHDKPVEGVTTDANSGATPRQIVLAVSPEDRRRHEDALRADDTSTVGISSADLVVLIRDVLRREGLDLIGRLAGESAPLPVLAAGSTDWSDWRGSTR